MREGSLYNTAPPEEKIKISQDIFSFVPETSVTNSSEHSFTMNQMKKYNAQSYHDKIQKMLNNSNAFSRLLFYRIKLN